MKSHEREGENEDFWLMKFGFQENLEEKSKNSASFHHKYHSTCIEIMVVLVLVNGIFGTLVKL